MRQPRRDDPRSGRCYQSATTVTEPDITSRDDFRALHAEAAPQVTSRHPTEGIGERFLILGSRVRIAAGALPLLTSSTSGSHVFIVEYRTFRARPVRMGESQS